MKCQCSLVIKNHQEKKVAVDVRRVASPPAGKTAAARYGTGTRSASSIPIASGTSRVFRVQLTRKSDVGFGFSVLGGAETELPPVIYDIVQNSPAGLCGQVRNGECVNRIIDQCTDFLSYFVLDTILSDVC